MRRTRLVTYSPKVFIPLTKLCRDVCHYCTFAAPPKRGERAYLTIDEVLEIARAGAAAGCREALFTLGDKPELRYRAARDELAELGCATTLEYLARAARAVLDETGLLPHLNPGVLTRDDARALRPLAASMGAMLETTSERLSQRGGPHFGSPDKLPAARLATLDAAGAERVPFTTGILIGIGETREERLDALAAIAAAHERHGHIQEVIVQNFRAKPGTQMADAPEPTTDDHLWTIAAARLILPPEIHLQAPPNLTEDFAVLLDAGIDDWGGVSPVTIDHVNPEAPWPAIDLLRDATRSRGLELAARLPVYPEWLDAQWLEPEILAARPPRIRRARTRARGRLGSRRAGRRSVRPARRATRRLARRARRGRDRASLRRARRGTRARLRRRRRAPSRGQRRHGQLRRDAEHPVHERLLLPLRLLRVLEGQARREPARPGVPRPARRDRAPRRGGVGTRRDGGLPPGRHPSGVHRRLLRVGRARDQGRRAGDARARVLRTRDLAGRRDARPPAHRLPGAAARRRAQFPAGHRRRGARRRDPRDHLPGQDHDRAVARGARRRALRRASLEQHDHVRPRRRAAKLGAPSRRGARAAAPQLRLHRVRAASVRAHGGADVPPGPRAPRADVRARRC